MRSSRFLRTSSMLGSLAALMTAAAVHADGPVVRYVDDDAAPGGDGLSWNTAFRDLQDAIEGYGIYGEFPIEVRIAQGIYKPDRGSRNQHKSFSLTSGSAILVGGFAGLGSADPNERDPKRFVSVLSGDLRGDDQLGPANRWDNSRHVLSIHVSREETVLLDGLTVRGGFAHGPYGDDLRGGGAFVSTEFYNGRVVLKRCRFTDNDAAIGGGAIGGGQFNIVTEDCVFDFNRAMSGKGGFFYGAGGAIHADVYLELQATRCVFANNECGGRGGVVAASASSITIRDSLFTNNRAPIGSAVDVTGRADFVSCTVVTNEYDSAATFSFDQAYIKIQGCIVARSPESNDAQPLFRATNSDITVESCSMRGGRTNVDTFATTLHWGDENLDVDPHWVSPAGPDGIVFTWQDNDFSLQPDSLCIDTGYTSAQSISERDLAGNQRTVSHVCACASRTDMGAFEVQSDCTPAPTPLLFVNQHAAAGGNGTCWSNAFRSLDEALNAPGGVSEIWVAAGIYTPGGAHATQDSRFIMNCTVQILGGFDGTEVSRELRNPYANPTVLSADLLANDTSDPVSREENATGVVSMFGSRVTLDGFTIKDAQSDAQSAIRVESSVLTLRRCNVRDNVAQDGSALSAIDSTLRVEDCRFEANSIQPLVQSSGAVRADASSVIFRDCTFAGNLCQAMYQRSTAGLYLFRCDGARIDGCDFIDNQIISNTIGARIGSAALLNVGSLTTVANCRFIANVTTVGATHGWATSGAAAIYGFNNTVINCLFEGNLAIAEYAATAAALALNDPASRVVNCTFVDNRSQAENPISGGITSYGDSTSTFANCILWGNRAGDRHDAMAQVGEIYNPHYEPISCCIEGWSSDLPGVNMISTDPLFVDRLGADGFVGTGDEDLRLSATSPCIDAGNTSSLPIDAADVDHNADRLERLPIDLAGRIRVSGPGVDIGAYELTAGACVADFSSDGVINSNDFFDYLAAFFAQLSSSDFDGNGTIDSVDLFGFIGVWLGGC